MVKEKETLNCLEKNCKFRCTKMKFKSLPRYRYPLYRRWDRECYSMISSLSTEIHSIKVIGTKEGINRFLRLLIRTQKMDDWRKFLKMVLRQLTRGSLDVPKLLEKGKELKIRKGYESWVIFKEDEEICEFLDEVEERRIEFVGSESEIVEFVLRFILAQLLMDWRGSLYALKEVIGKKKRVKIRSLNKVLSEFDYTQIFQKR